MAITKKTPVYLADILTNSNKIVPTAYASCDADNPNHCSPPPVVTTTVSPAQPHGRSAEGSTSNPPAAFTPTNKDKGGGNVDNGNHCKKKCNNNGGNVDNGNHCKKKCKNDVSKGPDNFCKKKNCKDNGSNPRLPQVSPLRLSPSTPHPKTVQCPSGLSIDAKCSLANYNMQTNQYTCAADETLMDLQYGGDTAYFCVKHTKDGSNPCIGDSVKQFSQSEGTYICIPQKAQPTLTAVPSPTTKTTTPTLTPPPAGSPPPKLPPDPTSFPNPIPPIIGTVSTGLNKSIGFLQKNIPSIPNPIPPIIGTVSTGLNKSIGFLQKNSLLEFLATVLIGIGIYLTYKVVRPPKAMPPPIEVLTRGGIEE